MKYCPYCGEALPLANAKFCPECGERLAAPAAPDSPRTRDGYAQDRPTPEELFRRAMDAEEDEEEVVILKSGRSSPGRYEAYRGPEPSRRNYIPVEVIEPEIHEETPASALQQPSLARSGEAGPPLRPEDYFVRDEPVAEATAKKAKRTPAGKTGHAPQRRSRLLAALLVVLVFLLLLGLGGGYLYLSWKAEQAPQKAVEAFADAVSAGDYQYILANLETSGSGLSSAQEVQSMVEDMREELGIPALKDHLLAQEGDISAGYDSWLSCFSLKELTNTLFSQKYVIHVKPVTVMVKTSLMDLEIEVDGKRADTEVVDGGFTLKVAPGTHVLSAAYGAYGTDYVVGQASFTSFSAQEPEEIVLDKNVGTAEIELAGTETGLQILVDGQKAEATNDGGFLLFDPVFEGMTITLQCDQYKQDFRVTGNTDNIFAVDYITQLEQNNPNATDPSQMSNRQLLTTLAPKFYSFYQSYLEAINSWNKELIRGVSEDYRAALIENMEAYNQGLLFDFHGMTFDRRSIARNTRDGELYASFQVQVDFNYANKNDSSKWYKGGNFQVVTMHYLAEGNTWEVSASNMKEDMEFSPDTFTIAP